MAFVMVVAIEIDAPSCEEIGRVSRAYVSAHNRTRVHLTQLFPNEKRCLVANLNGAVAKSRTIKRVEWRLDQTGLVAMSDGSIDGRKREAQVTIQARYYGTAAVRCEMTLDNGENYVQMFRVVVQDGPSFGDSQLAGGPSAIVVDA